MKILQAFDFFSPQHGGGTVDNLYHLSRALVRRGHEVTIYTSDFELDQGYIDSLLKVKVYPFHSWLNLAGLRLTPGLFTETKQNLKDFDIIHLHSSRSFQNIVVHHYAKKYGIPYVVDAHGSTIRLGKRKRKILFDVTFGYKILRDASKVIAETEVGVNEYKELGVDKDKIVSIGALPFDIEEFSHLPPPGRFRSKYNIKDRQIVLFLGRIHWIKGLEFLVEAFYELAQYKSEAILVIVGPDDGYKSTLDKLISELSLSDRVLFTGFLSGEEKLSVLVDANVMVQTSMHEQGAGPPFEAVLCNTPIIVSQNTGAGENVSQIDAGYLIEWGNKDALRSTIQYVLDNPAETNDKTQKGKEYIVSNLSWQKQVEKYEQLYSKCIATRENCHAG